MILKHRDTEVLRFDWAGHFGVKNVEVNPVAEQFLPIAFREQVRKDHDSLRYWLEEWLQHRTPPLKRRGILFKTTTRTISRHIKALKDAGELIRIGSDKTGYWQVVEKV